MSRDDWARLPLDYHDDPELAFVHDTIEDEFGVGYLTWLYWPTIVTSAKAAKAFGWFRATPRQVAAKVGDKAAENWDARIRMWTMFAQTDRIRIRQETIASPFEQIDVLYVDYEELQSLSNREHSKLRREREKHAAGQEVHWTLRHWSVFAFSPIGYVVSDEAAEVARAASSVIDTDSLSHPTVSVDHRQTNSVDDTSRLSSNDYETRQDETKEGARERTLPTSVMETIEQVRSIPGMSRFQLESNVRKAMTQFPSLDEAAVCEAITAFEANVPEGATLKSGQSWTKLRNCFEVARRRMDEAAHSGPSSRRGGRLTPGTAEWRQAVAASLGSPEGSAA